MLMFLFLFFMEKQSVSENTLCGTDYVFLYAGMYGKHNIVAAGAGTGTALSDTADQEEKPEAFFAVILVWYRIDSSWNSRHADLPYTCNRQ